MSNSVHDAGELFELWSAWYLAIPRLNHCLHYLLQTSDIVISVRNRYTESYCVVYPSTSV